MKSYRNTVLIAFLVVLVASLGGLSEAAARYPERDIVCIAPAPPGGGLDVISRIAAKHLPQYLPNKVNILIQNIGAVGGRVGWMNLCDAKPDGYTIGGVEPIAPIVAKAMGEFGQRDPLKVTWFARVSHTPFMLGVGTKNPVQSLKDLKGKRVRAATTQNSILPSIAILRALGAELQPVNYGGGSDSCLAVMRGDVDVVVTPGATLMRHASSSGGRLIPMVAFSETRLSIAPEVPTFKELGISLGGNLLAVLDMHYVYAAPPGLPAEIYKILSEGLQKMYNDPAAAQDFEKAKMPISVQPAEFVQKTVAALMEIALEYKDVLMQAPGK